MGVVDEINNRFVDDYDVLQKYKHNINKTLEQMGFDGFYSYNEFCIKIKNNFIKDTLENNIVKIDEEIFSKALNKTFRDKIREDGEYEDKLMFYFNDKNILDFIKDEPL